MSDQGRAWVVIHLDAGHTRDGNPRRLYVALSGERGHTLGVWDEGYDGYAAVPEPYQQAAKYGPTFKTTPGQYRELRQWKGEGR